MAEANLCLVASRVLELLRCENIVRTLKDDDRLSLEESISQVLPLLLGAEKKFLLDAEKKFHESGTRKASDYDSYDLSLLRLGRALHDAEDRLEIMKMSCDQALNKKNKKQLPTPRMQELIEDLNMQINGLTKWMSCDQALNKKNKKQLPTPRMQYDEEERLKLIRMLASPLCESNLDEKELLEIEAKAVSPIDEWASMREDDKKAILDILLDTDPEFEGLTIDGYDSVLMEDENAMVVRSVFNDDKVQAHFALRVWVDFTTGYSSPGDLTFSTIRNSNMDMSLSLIQKSVQNKRCMIVLEGLRHRDYYEMNRTMQLIQRGILEIADILMGKIRVIYISNGVADILEGGRGYRLRRLWPGEDRAKLKDGCIGTLLNFYDNLPSPLKHCFAYCSLFSDQHEIDVQSLIRLWMAQGFITMGDDTEDIGYDYFTNLLQRSFFHEIKLDGRRRVKKCKIPYLVYKMATRRSGRLCTRGTYNLDNCSWENIPLHISIDSNPNFERTVNKNSFPWRSLLNLTQQTGDGHQLVNVLLDSVIKKCRFLRALDMHACGIKMVPHLIGELKLLRYLDLSQNKDIIELPDSITKLQNLQTLNLSSCSGLKRFPMKMGNLVNLRHLQTDGCYNLTGIPQGFGRLTNLRTLSQVVLNEDHYKARAELDELSKLSNLREIKIKKLRHEMGEHNASCLNSLQRVQSLSLEWKSGVHKSNGERESITVDRFHDLEELTLDGFRSATVMFTVRSVPQNLSKLVLRRLVTCRPLPTFQDHCQLKVLVLDEIMDCEYVWEDFSTKTCQSLEELWLIELPNLRGWCEKDNNIVLEEGQNFPSFKRLSRLVIEDCPKLISMPVFPTLEEGLVLDSTSWELFRKTMSQKKIVYKHVASTSSNNHSSPLSKLKNLCIISIKGFDNLKGEEIAWDTLESLKMLKLDYLPEMTNFPEGLRNVTRLQELHIWRCGTEDIPEWIGELELLESLVIRACPNMKSLPKSIRKLKKLHTLEIEECPTLLWRCRKETGADWKKIKHIPNLRLGRVSAT